MTILTDVVQFNEQKCEYFVHLIEQNYIHFVQHVEQIFKIHKSEALSRRDLSVGVIEKRRQLKGLFQGPYTVTQDRLFWQTHPAFPDDLKTEKPPRHHPLHGAPDFSKQTT